MKLWYKSPARRWDQALPLGNGRLGAMVYGTTEAEHIQLNEDSVWGGNYVDRHNPDCLENLEEMRRLVFEDKIEEAERLANYAFTATPQSERPYQTLGDIIIQHYNMTGRSNREKFTDMQNQFRGTDGKYVPPFFDYKRSLELDTAVANTEFNTALGHYEREYFISYPDDVLVMRLTSGEENPLDFDVSFDRRRNLDHAFKVSSDTIAYDGNTGENAIKFTGMLKAVANKGTVKTIGEHLIVTGATDVMLVFTAATSFRHFNPYKTCQDILEKACKKSYEELKSAHIADHKALFDRVKLNFKTDVDREDIPTDERLAAIKNGTVDPQYIAMYYQYGRYLLIAGSRPGTLPATLQGIWCDQYMPSWDSKYTININTEMNYWPAESGNLSECQLPLFDLLDRMKVNGQKTAKVMYNCRGFVAHHNTDIYADTAPQDKWISSTYWPMGAAWLSTHIMMHYDYTQDKEFLENQYDTLYQATLFFNDFLVEAPDGALVTCPSISPENTFILPDGSIGRLTAGPTMDNQILNVLFDDYIRASEILGRDADFREKVKEMKARLPKTEIGQYGQIMEWRKDYEEIEPGHRHVSQLYGVYPGNLITAEETPELLKAAQATLERRLAHGGGHTGWSRAWIILLWTRFGNPAKVMENIQALFTRSTFENMMDNHPMGDYFVFQIDGNLGAAAGITEMLVQSYGSHIRLLPAVPEELGTGSISGLKLPGGAECCMTYENGNVVTFELKAEQAMKRDLSVNGELIQLDIAAGETYTYQA